MSKENKKQKIRILTIYHTTPDVVSQSSMFFENLLPELRKNVISKSFLHHVDPVKELKEIKRVTSKKGFLFLWEPGRYNLIAAVGRKFFPTRDHVSSEEPFDPSVLRELTLNYFGTIIYEEYFFINTVILPVLAKHCKLFKSKKLMSILVKFDGFLCRSFFKKFSWIIIIGAKKG